MHINRMQKALVEMNIHLKEVLSQIHGKTWQVFQGMTSEIKTKTHSCC